MFAPLGDPTPEGTRVDLDGVTKRYGHGDTAVVGLADADLHVDERSFVVILGASGSGKTTLLNVIGALDSPDEGTVRINGVDITKASRAERFAIRRRTVSFVFQSFNLFPGLTALENVQFGAEVAGRDGPADLAGDLLARVGLGSRLRHFPSQMSGGEQQRVAIARALATGNPILLADEPTGELDFRSGVQILELLWAQAEAGTTVMIVTHNREMSRVADRVVELSSGRIVSDGTPTEGRARIDELRW